MILWLEVDSVEDLADFGRAGANPADYSVNFPVDPILGPREIYQLAHWLQAKGHWAHKPHGLHRPTGPTSHRGL